MRFIEYSVESLLAESRKLASLVGAEYEPDAIAYLAKGGYLIGGTFSRFFDAPLIEMAATRSGDPAKRVVASVLQSLPKGIKRLMREIEAYARIKEKADPAVDSRSIEITGRYPVPKKAKRVLIVDDSVDTGASLLLAMGLIRQAFPNAEIRSTAINVFTASQKAVNVDWALYENVLLSTPASKDNREYEKFKALYAEALE
ncbi:phosphoribosyltransferase [Eggerthella guodeyinii]|uniref:Phosphoribosyltransferase domain-containing protein n=1 Tax=Eggerthella guodeyinii TaxID=2690837 RepID=A0A6N7RLY6_9ACTN|nr:phosphoribosyltransferase family protein [Eggerthella guodeyinii]MRX82333.1 hypothetical protein [Eggerthella guodeyinii]